MVSSFYLWLCSLPWKSPLSDWQTKGSNCWSWRETYVSKWEISDFTVWPLLLGRSAGLHQTAGHDGSRSSLYIQQVTGSADGKDKRRVNGEKEGFVRCWEVRCLVQDHTRNSWQAGEPAAGTKKGMWQVKCLFPEKLLRKQYVDYQLSPECYFTVILPFISSWDK